MSFQENYPQEIDTLEFKEGLIEKLEKDEEVRTKIMIRNFREKFEIICKNESTVTNNYAKIANNHVEQPSLSNFSCMRHFKEPINK